MFNLLKASLAVYPNKPKAKAADFSTIIEHAKRCESPQEIETGEIVGGFNHRTLWDLKDKIIGAVQSGKIKRFFVMAGCDGRHPSREYYTEFAKALPKEAVILTAGCAKYRYNKVITDDIDGTYRGPAMGALAIGNDPELLASLIQDAASSDPALAVPAVDAAARPVAGGWFVPPSPEPPP